MNLQSRSFGRNKSPGNIASGSDLFFPVHGSIYLVSMIPVTCLNLLDNILQTPATNIFLTPPHTDDAWTNHQGHD